MLTSSSSSSPLSYPSFCLPLSNLFQKAVFTQNMTNPFIRPSCHCKQDIPLLHDYLQHFFISHTIGPTDLFHHSPAPHFRTFQVYLIYCPIPVLSVLNWICWNTTEQNSWVRHCNRLKLQYPKILINITFSKTNLTPYISCHSPKYAISTYLKVFPFLD